MAQVLGPLNGLPESWSITAGRDSVRKTPSQEFQAMLRTCVQALTPSFGKARRHRRMPLAPLAVQQQAAPPPLPEKSALQKSVPLSAPLPASAKRVELPPRAASAIPLRTMSHPFAEPLAAVWPSPDMRQAVAHQGDWLGENGSPRFLDRADQIAFLNATHTLRPLASGLAESIRSSAANPPASARLTSHRAIQVLRTDPSLCALVGFVLADVVANDDTYQISEWARAYGAFPVSARVDGDESDATTLARLSTVATALLDHRLYVSPETEAKWAQAWGVERPAA